MDSCTPGTPAADDSTCNGIDDDCNGPVDEDYVSTPTTCGVGACAATGTTSCVRGQRAWTPARLGRPAADDSICNGIDDDCNGAVDEDYVSMPTTCGVGACAATGSDLVRRWQVVRLLHAGDAGRRRRLQRHRRRLQRRGDDDYVSTADDLRRRGVRCDRQHLVRCRWRASTPALPGTAGAPTTTCNGIDDDCNGAVDDGLRPLADGLRRRRLRRDRRDLVRCGAVVRLLRCRALRPPTTRPATASTTTATARWTRATLTCRRPAASGACAATGSTVVRCGVGRRLLRAGAPARR